MSWRSRVRINTVALIITAILSIFALGFAGFAIYQVLLLSYPPSIAAAITAGGYAGAAILAMLIAKLAVYQIQKDNSAPRPKPADMNELENILQMVVVPAVSKMVQQHPGKSVITTLLAGVIVGYNDETRSAAKNIIKRFFEDK